MLLKNSFVGCCEFSLVSALADDCLSVDISRSSQAGLQFLPLATRDNTYFQDRPSEF